jgi:hypothetical protein
MGYGHSEFEPKIIVLGKCIEISRLRAIKVSHEDEDTRINKIRKIINLRYNLWRIAWVLSNVQTAKR